MRATADFSQRDLKGVQAKRTKGHILGDGSFIFSWINDVHRKMVLVSKYGQTMQDGHVDVSSSTWTNPKTWTTKSKGFYSVSNFVPRQGKWNLRMMVCFFELTCVTRDTSLIKKVLFICPNSTELKQIYYMKSLILSTDTLSSLIHWNPWPFLFTGPYLLFTLLKTWNEAEKHCKDLKGYLATIASDEINDHLTKQMSIK